MDQMFENMSTEIRNLRERLNHIEAENVLLKCKFRKILLAVLVRFTNPDKLKIWKPIDWFKAISVIKEILVILNSPCDET